MDEDKTERIEGVDFTDIMPILEELSYPITATELVELYGDHEIKRTNAGPISIRELFEVMGDDTIDSIDSARHSILTLMPKDSEGRQRYSDRGLTIDDPYAYFERADRALPGHDRQDERS